MLESRDTPHNVVALELGVDSSGGLSAGSCWVETQQVQNN